MSRALSRGSLARVPNLLVCVVTVALLGGCQHRPPVARATARVAPHFPGVDLIDTRHRGFRLRIRSGLVGSGEPLYVIDGMPMAIDPNRGIDWFEPEDIEHIRVLKTPSELAVYGARGANGVIEIDTKLRGRR